MYMSFYISEARLDELKSFIRDFTPTVRFEHNPLKSGGDGLFIALTMEVEDGNKISGLQEKWHTEDNPPKKPNKSIWHRIRMLNVLKF